MNCAELLDALRKGDPLESPEAAAHLAACPDCAPLAGGEWTAALRGADTAAPLDVAALQAGLQGRLAKERGALAWLRSRPTWLRRALLLGIVFPYPIAMVFAARIPCPRPDLPSYPPGRFATELCCMGTVVIAGAWTALRSPHRPALRSGAAALLATAALLLAIALAVMPQAHDGGSLKSAGHCLSFGLLCGLPMAACALLLARLVTWPVVVLSATAAGISADLVLHLTCPSPEPMHLLLGHASVVGVYVGTVLLVGLLRKLAFRSAPA